jgi:polar amino acid transport system substrate-binding protein
MRRVAGVVERGGLENRCTPRVPRVRIPDSPPLLFKKLNSEEIMRYFSKIILLFIILFSGLYQSCPLFAGDFEELRILTENYPPLNFEEGGELRGLAVDVVREIFSRLDIKKEIYLVNWEAGYKEALAEKNMALFSTVLTPERKEHLQWVGPIAVINTNVYALKHFNITASNLEDLKKISGIATVKDYYNEQVLIKEGFQNIHSCTSEDVALKKMLNGEVDAMVSSNTTISEYLKKNIVSIDDLEEVFTLSTDLAYIAFSKGTSVLIVDEWQMILDEMKSEGIFDKIYTKWLPNEVPPGTLMMITEEYPPVTFMKNGDPSGFVTDIVREIATLLDVPANIKLTSWKNAYNMALLQPNVILFSAERTAERENLFQWVGPVGKNTSILYAKKGSQITIDNLAEAKKINAIATTTDWFTEQHLINEGFNNLLSSADPVDNIKQLMNGEVQLSIFTDITISEILNKTEYTLDDLEPVFTVEKTYFYIAISKGTPPQVVKGWQTTLDEIKKEGIFKKIYHNYIPNADIDDLLYISQN